MRMIVGIDYTQDGSRTIAYLAAGFHKDEEEQLLYFAESAHDEVYLTEVDQNSQEFIEAIITEGEQFS